MKKNIMIALLLCIVLCLTGCNGGGESDKTTQSASATASSGVLLGTWKGTGDEHSTITFGTDGRCKDDFNYDGIQIVTAGPYTINEADSTVLIHDDEYGLDFLYTYTISGNDLTMQLEGGNPRTFRKQ